MEQPEEEKQPLIESNS
jgi:hypothetical protein